MNETIKITHGNGLVTELAARDIGGTSFIRGRDAYYFLVYERCGQQAWKISEFSSKEDANAQRHHIEREYSRIMSR
jgi:hypothetical protein